MQPVLVIDLTKDPSMALVVDASSPDCDVLARAQAPLGDYLAAYRPRNDEVTDGNDKQEPAAEPEKAEQEAPPPVKNLLQKLTVEWTNCIIIVPPLDYVSLTLRTPFGDPKRLAQILALEIQDTVPFELDDMHLHYGATKRPQDGDYEIHVALFPKSALEALLAACSEAEVDPTIIMPASAVLELIYKSAADAPADTAVLYSDYPHFALGLFVDGRLCAEKESHAELAENNGSDNKAFVRSTLNDFRAALRSFEQQHELEIEHLLMLGEPFPEGALDELFPKQKKLKVPVPEGSSCREFLARKAALFGGDRNPPTPLVNFRTGAYAVGIRWKDVFGGIEQLVPYFAAFVGCLVIGLCGMYYGRKMHLETVRATTVSQIRGIIPSIDPNTDKPSDFIRAEISAIQRQLRDLGSPFKVSPLDALVEISKDFQKRSGSTITRVDIVGDKVTLEGTAPNYSSIENIEKALKKKKRTYCDVKNEVNSSGPGNTGVLRFSFKVELCE